MSEGSQEYFAIKKQIHELEVILQTTANLTPEKEEELHKSIAALNRSIKEHLPFEFICSKCGKQSAMPIKPRKTKPNYCKKCFWEING